ncbi:hypothetical protein ACOME3_007707 [Neoechinorhynchus agilis]
MIRLLIHPIDCSVDHNGKPIDLPFLLKVLSIEKPLSIQLHPDIKLARSLHQANPHLYPDSNHKPELVIALTHFPIMCNFRPITDVLELLEQTPLLKSILLTGLDTDSINTVTLFKRLLMISENELERVFEEILSLQTLPRLVQKYFHYLNTEYPYDIGVLMIFVLQIHELEPLEAMYVQAMVPHAYLGGRCEAIEIMANSDNVIRVGLTPKPKDIETILNWTEYNQFRVEKFIPYHLCSGLSIYEIDGIHDFGLRRYDYSEKPVVLNSQSASIIFIADGKVRIGVPGDESEHSAGEAFYLDPDMDVHLQSIHGNDYVVFHAYSLMPQ